VLHQERQISETLNVYTTRVLDEGFDNDAPADGSDLSDSDFLPCAQPPRASNSSAMKRPDNSRAAKGLRRNTMVNPLFP
jgi:hypothetical protein